eukprot:1248869-Rhodomonas_salina.1
MLRGRGRRAGAIRWIPSARVKDNMCGECKSWGSGGFELRENAMGIRFNGASFDDNQIGKGSYQAMNICILA